MKQSTFRPAPVHNRKLLAYSSSAVLFLAATPEAFSQTMYTDIEPDAILEAPGAIYDLDLNGDAISDFTFSATSAGSYLITSLGANVFYGIRGVFINPATSNSVAATSGSLPGFAYPYVLASSVNVGGGQLFLNESFQTLAYSFFASHDGAANPIHQYGQWLGGETDKFIGFKFLVSGNVHYGWARLDVDASNKKMTLKDYAYEDTPNTPIHTQIGVSIQEETNSTDVIIYVFENTLVVSLHDVKQIPCKVFIYDISGNVIFTSNLQEESNRIDLSYLPVSAYVMKVQTPKAIVSAQLSVVK